MGIADAIVDLVSSGTTLRENNLKEIEGGVILESQVNSLLTYPEACTTSLIILSEEGLWAINSKLSRLSYLFFRLSLLPAGSP